MKKIWIIAVLGIMALASCESKIDLPGDVSEKPVSSAAVFTATTESAATKTTLDDNYNVLWQNGDLITIVDGAGHVGVYETTSTTSQGDFTHSSGEVANTPSYTAYYPSTIYNGGTLTLPAEQTYVAENISGAPMMAVSSTTSLGFKNLGGIIKLSLTTNQTDKKVSSIALSANQGMSGTFTVSEDAAVVSGTAGVTLNCGTEGVAISSTPVNFYIAVPANTYTGLSITVTTTTGAYQTFTLKSDKNVVVGRNQMTSISLSANNILYDLPSNYNSVEYLESTGTQYIDTGVPCSWQDFVDIDFMYTASNPNPHSDNVGGSVFGAHGWSKANGIYEACIYWRGYGKITYSFALNTQYNVKTIDATHSSINGTTYQIDVTSSAGAASSNFALFANYSDYYNAWTYYSVARIYSCKLYDSNHVWLRYFVPCVRTSDGKPGMYDRVNDAFYVNEGTGEFTTNLTPTVTSYDLTTGNVTVPAGETAIVTGSNTASVLTIGAGATVTLVDATLKQINTNGDATLTLVGDNTAAQVGVHAITIADNSTLTINGDGSLDCTRLYKDQERKLCILGSNSNLIVEGGTLTLVANQYRGDNSVRVRNYTQTGGNVTISVSAGNNAGNSFPVGLYAYNDVLITGGTITSTGSTAIAAGNNMTISGGAVTALGHSSHYYGSVGLGAVGTLTISGGTVMATGSGGDVTGPGIGTTGTCGDIVITGGDITAVGTVDYSGRGSAGIGTSSAGGTCGNITVTDGIVRLAVSKGNASAQAPIGKGNASSSVGTITIDGVENPTAESFFTGLSLAVSNGGNTWTLTPASNTPASLANLKDMVNADKDCSAYLGRYVYSNGSIGTDATDAIGRIAHVSPNASTDASSVAGSRIMVLALTNLATDVDVAGANAAITGTPVIEGASQTAWKIPTYWEWVDMGKSLGHGNFQTLIEAVGMDTSTRYWTASSSNGGYGRYYVYYASGTTSNDVANWYYDFATRTPHPTLRACFAY